MYTTTLFDRHDNAIRLPRIKGLDEAVLQAKTNLQEDPTYLEAIITDSQNRYVAKLKTRYGGVKVSPRDRGSDLFWMIDGKWVKAD